MALLDGQAAGEEKQLNGFIEMGLPRLFLVEGEYAVSMKRAERDWVRRLIGDIEGGRLWISKEDMQGVQAKFENRTEGGENQ
jgi:hypothetical protein